MMSLVASGELSNALTFTLHDCRKAWDAEGSPFKGTPFDPSAVNIQDSGPMGGAGLPPFP